MQALPHKSYQIILLAFCCANSNKTLRGMHMVTVRYPFHSHSLIDDNEMAQGASDKHWKDESDDNCS